MKKVFGVGAFLLSMVALVSAQDGLASGFGKGMSQVISLIESVIGPFFSAILGGESGMLFEKVLFLAIILTTVYVIIGKTPVFTKKDGNPNLPVVWIVSISVALLSTRFMSGDLLKTMLLPYTTLGVTLTAVIPLIIYFMFVLNIGASSPTLSKILWIFYIVTFVTIWTTRYNDIGVISYIYMGSAIMALIFLLADGTIRRALEKQREKELSMDDRKQRIAKIKEEMNDVLDLTLDEAAKARIIRRYQKRIETIAKM